MQLLLVVCSILLFNILPDKQPKNEVEMSLFVHSGHVVGSEMPSTPNSRVHRVHISCVFHDQTLAAELSPPVASALFLIIPALPYYFLD